MHTTSPSLLYRLRSPLSSEAWQRFVDLYAPLLYYWSHQAGLRESDAADVVQDVLLTLLNKLPGFEYQPGRSFRNWLWTITKNRCREWHRHESLRRGEPLSDLAEPTIDDPSVIFADNDYFTRVIRQALFVMKRDFQTTTWQACWEHVVIGRPVQEVASELGLTINAVYIAKARVLKRLRKELEGLLE